MQTSCFRKQFPYFSNGDVPVYLDSAATSQRLQSVLDRQVMFDSYQYASVHRAMYTTATQSTREYENVRSDIADWLHAVDCDVVFTSGATHALNIVANGLGPELLSGSKILICESEHHANILPWQQLAKKHNLGIEILKLKSNGTFDEECLFQWLDAIDDSCAIVACAHVSNVLGNIYPVAQICAQARKHNAISVIDGTQAVAHLSVDLQKIDCDFYAFSGHKMYASTGIGVLVGKRQRLSALQPYSVGGEMVATANFTDFTAQPSPLKFEAGTPNISAVMGLGAAITFLRENMDDITAHKAKHFAQLQAIFKQHPDIRLLGAQQGNYQENTLANVGIQSFFLPGEDNHQLALQLWDNNIALRYGQHCAMPLFSALGVSACLRVSIGCYTDASDIERFAAELNNALGNKISRNRGDNNVLDTASNDATSNDAKTQEQLDKLKQAADWGSKNRLLMHLSASLNTLPEEQRNQSNTLAGCESQVWIDRDETGHWCAYSDSKTVRGLLTFILMHFSDAKTAQDMHALLSEYGLSKYFSVGRKNGINRVVSFLYADE